MKLCDMNPFMRCAVLQPSVKSCPPLSCSYDYRIFYILEGTADFVLSDRTIPISQGMLLYFRPGTPYYFDGKVKVIVLNFDMTRNQADQKTPRTPSRTVTDFDPGQIFENDPPEELKSLVIIPNAFALEHKIQECLFHYCYPTPISDALTSAILKDMLCFIAQNAVGSESPEIVQRIKLYIQENYHAKISNSQLSRTLGYHSYYLNRVFKKSTGITIHQAVLLEKIRIAEHLLKETDLSVQAVAAEVGFSDRSQFITAFKKCNGYTPLEYRKSSKNSG